ncbi:MAG: peptide MFS transporter [Myxococcales bacterium]|nr:peptide MFS transporter [Myxococcales bacterium]
MQITNANEGASAGADEHKEQPRGLYVLFSAEAWERFSYYGMRALLVLYMTQHLHYERANALEIYALYTGLVYLTPLIGGALADSLLGRRKAVLIGGVLMALGHLAMAFEPLLFHALGLLIVGNGFFKPNISTIVGGLYSEGDNRRDGGFTIFYMGINLGAFFSPIVCGFLGEKVGWHFGFSAAAVGMLLGLVVFAMGQKLFGTVGLPPGRAPDKSANVGTGAYREGEAQLEAPMLLERRDYIDVAIWVAGGTAVVVALLFAWKFIGPMWATVGAIPRIILGLLAAFAVGFKLFRGSNSEEVQRLIVVVILCVFNVFFWMGFEQAGGTMTLFAADKTDRSLGWFAMIVIVGSILAAAVNIYYSTREQVHARKFWLGVSGLFVIAAGMVAGPGVIALVKTGHYELPASQFQAINPLLIVALGPLFSKMWTVLDEGRFKTSAPTKMAIGMIVLGLGFIVMYIGQQFSTGGKVSPNWLVAVYAIHTVGELCLSPIGLSMVTRLAPNRVVSLAMGLWFLSSFFANYAAGILEHVLERRHVPIYGFLVVSSIGPALVLLAITPILKKWMHGRG